MAFFPRNLYNSSDASFTPLFRLLDDFDSYSRQGGQNGNGTRRSGLSHWQPKFDVRETGESYELHGELPGMKKSDVHIEFTEPQTMLIRGKTERTYTAGTPPAGLIEGNEAQGAIEGSEEHKNNHHATVEDEEQAKAHETSTEVTHQQQNNDVQKKPADQSKYWLTERSFGEFSRSFNFPTRVDQDNVSAKFNDGILSIVVPKAKKHESRRINVE